MTITNSLTSSSSSSSASSSSSSSSMSSSTSSYDSNLIYQSSASSLSSSLDSLSSYQNRNQNALQKRAQQLRRWKEIEELEQKEQNAIHLKPRTPTKVCFSPTTLFLSACAQRDFEECERLLKLKELQDAGGVNVANCDGLTALHQACIDDNEPMVRWLLSKQANINCKDNEGWTPLHAAANCGNLNIVKILISNPVCDLFALNCDNELACDVCETKECEDLIRGQMDVCLNYNNKRSVFRKFQRLDGDSKVGSNDYNDDDDENEEVFKNLRQQELKAIEQDITKWIESIHTVDIKKEIERTRDPLSGATIIHVCAAKGYNDALERFLSAFSNQIDLDSFRDCDGYTALHAAAFWRQPETFETLLKYGANPDLLTEKTSDNIISSSVLELCKNDPKFIELIEVNKEKEKIAKESETQRKIFAKRQRETRRSTQGVKKEDLEQALKLMETSCQNTPSSENDNEKSSSIQKINETNNNNIIDNDSSVQQKKNPETDSSSTIFDNIGSSSNGSINVVDDNEPVKLTAKLPLKPPLPTSTQPISTTITIAATTTSTPSSSSITASTDVTETDVNQIDRNNSSSNNNNTSLSTNATVNNNNNNEQQPETPPTVTMKISSTTPAEFARRRRIKRRATGIEDDSGHALSPDVLSDSNNPLGNVNAAGVTNAATGKTEEIFSPNVDAAFDVILTTPVNQSRISSSSRTIRPVSNASSLSSLNSIRSGRESEENNNNISAASSMNSLASSYAGDNQYQQKDAPYSSDNVLNNNSSTSSNYGKNSTSGGTTISNNTTNSNSLNSNEIDSMTLLSSSTAISSDDIDYKKLCKQLLRENETLRRRIKELEEAEKKREQEYNREKRASQRTISELEEELKAMNDIKADNMRLKDENAALIRVISKLSKN